MARKRFNHSKLKVVGKKRKLVYGDWLNSAMTNLYQDSFYDLYGRNPIGQVGKTQHVQVPEMPGYPYHAAARRTDSNRPEVEKDFDILPDVAAERRANAAANAAYSGAPDGTTANQLALYKELSPGYKDAFDTFWGKDKYIKKVFTEDDFKKNNTFWKKLGKGIESIASKTSSIDPQDPSNAFFGGKYVAGVELGANIFGKKYNRGVKGAQTVNAVLDVLPLEEIKVGDIPVGAIGKAAGKDLAALAQQAWGYKYNDENIAKVEDATAAANNNTATYNNYDAIMNANFNHAFNFSNKYIGDQGWLSHGIDDKADELRLLSDRADKREKLNLATSIDQTSDALLRALNRNWTAYGGRLRRPHKFVEGGAVVNTGNPSDIGGGWFSDMGNLFSKGWFQHAGKGVSSMYKSGQLNGVISSAGDFAYKGLSGGMNTNVGVGNAMNKLGDVAAMVPGPYGAIASAALKTVGGLTNRMFGSKLNYENINEVKGDIAAANANTATLNDYDSIMNNNWNNANYVSKSYIGKDGWFSNKAKKTWRRLMTQVGRASDRENLAQAVSTEQVGMNTMKGLERQWAAYGGSLRAGLDTALNNRIAMNKRAYNTRSAYNANGVPVINVPNLNVPYATGGDIDDFTEYGLGGRIKIKKENRGKFTKSAKRAGMSVQQYAKHVLANPDKYSPQERKRANFALNAKKWKKALGGDLFNALAYGGWTAPNPYVRHLVTGGSKKKAWWDYDWNDAAAHFQKEMGSGWTKQTAEDFNAIKTALDTYADANLTDSAKKAIVQTIYRESSFNPNASGTDSKGNKYGGLFQWSEKFRGDNIKKTGAQAQINNFLDETFKTGFSKNGWKKYYLNDIIATDPRGLGAGMGGTPADLFTLQSLSPEQVAYGLSSAYVTNGRNAETVRLEARAMAKLGKYLTEPGKITQAELDRQLGLLGETRAWEPEQQYSPTTYNLDEILAMVTEAANNANQGYSDVIDAQTKGLRAEIERLERQNEQYQSAQRAIEDQKRKDVVASLFGIPTKESIFASIMAGNKKKDKEKEERGSGMVNPYVLQRSFGGELGTQGGDFTNGLTQINAGGAHETNPYEGVPMGTDLGGTPNVVEEGETIYEDYVFSNRLYVPAEFIKKHKLGHGGSTMTFAEASKKLARESEERPNDPISLAGLGVDMQELRETQEDVKMKKQQEEMMRQQEQAQSLEEMMALMGGVPTGPMGGPGEEGMSPRDRMMAQQMGMSPDEALAMMQGNPEGGMSPEEAAALMAQQSGQGGMPSGMPSDMVAPEGMPEGEPGLEQQLAEEKARQQAETDGYYAYGGRLGRRVNKFDGPDSPSSTLFTDTTPYFGVDGNPDPEMQWLYDLWYKSIMGYNESTTDEQHPGGGYDVGTLKGLKKALKAAGYGDYFDSATTIRQIENSPVFKRATRDYSNYLEHALAAQQNLYDAYMQNSEIKSAIEAYNTTMAGTDEKAKKTAAETLNNAIKSVFAKDVYNDTKEVVAAKEALNKLLRSDQRYNIATALDSQTDAEAAKLIGNPILTALGYKDAFADTAQSEYDQRVMDGLIGAYHIIPSVYKAPKEEPKPTPESPDPLTGGTDNDKIEPIKYGYSKIGDALTAGQVIADIAGLNGPDYTEANTLMNLAGNMQAPHVSAPTIQTRLQDKPYDIMQLVNDERAKYAGTSRMIANTAGNNRGLVEAALLANRSSQNPNSESYVRSLGDLYATMAQANDKRKQEIATFNYNTDKANADNILEAAAKNAENFLQAQKERVGMYQAAQNLRYNERTGTDEAHGNNLAALIQRQYDKDQNALQWAALNAYMPVTGGYDLNQYLTPLWGRKKATQETT